MLYHDDGNSNHEFVYICKPAPSLFFRASSPTPLAFRASSPTPKKQISFSVTVKSKEVEWRSRWWAVAAS